MPTKSSDAGGRYPGGKRFAFSIIDDTDVATVANVRPIYALLNELGIKTTKTVWPLPCPEGSKNFCSSQTLAEPDYLAFVRELQQNGFEITWHAATMESSPRQRTLAGFEEFRRLIGHYPRVHANHAENRENLYWGHHRLDNPLLRRMLQRALGMPADYFCGHVPGTPYWWGDLCAERCRYVRNLTFNRLNLERINPSMPYRDPRRPHAPLWFSASDAEDVIEFNHLLRGEQQQALESEGGFCIVATHFGKDFVKNGRVNATTEARLRELALRPGWFVPVGTLLDHLATERGAEIGAPEWRTMQWRWAFDLLQRKLRRRFTH